MNEYTFQYLFFLFRFYKCSPNYKSDTQLMGGDEGRDTFKEIKEVVDSLDIWITVNKTN